jgi:hypothetical protein
MHDKELTALLARRRRTSLCQRQWLVERGLFLLLLFLLFHFHAPHLLLLPITLMR